MRRRSRRASRKDGTYLSPAQNSDTHVRSVEFFCHSRARVWRARGIPNSAGGRGEGPGFFARQPRARMTEQEIEQDRNCHYDLQSSLKLRWERTVQKVDAPYVEKYYDAADEYIEELMWWHTLADDISPLAYVVALEFASSVGCKACLDFGSGVGSGALLFRRHSFDVTPRRYQPHHAVVLQISL